MQRDVAKLLISGTAENGFSPLYPFSGVANKYPYTASTLCTETGYLANFICFSG